LSDEEADREDNAKEDFTVALAPLDPV